MKSSTDYSIAESVSILLVGNPKTGKTNIAASFPAPYFLDIDGNLASAVRELRKSNKKFYYDNPVKDAKTKADVYKLGLAALNAAKDHPDIGTVVLDSISMYVDFICEWIVAEHIRLGDNDKSGKPITTMTLPDFGKLLNILKSIVFDLRKSGKYVVVTSHQTTTKDDLTGIVHKALAMPGSAKDTFGGCFTDVWGTDQVVIPGGKTKFMVYTAPVTSHVPLGRSVRSMPKEFDLTDKSLPDIWAMLSPHLSAQATA